MRSLIQLRLNFISTIIKLYYLTAPCITSPLSSALEIAIRLIAWTILGAIVALGISYFIPNLERFRAFLGGSLGGV
jgi:hypothetical protein